MKPEDKAILNDLTDPVKDPMSVEELQSNVVVLVLLGIFFTITMIVGFLSFVVYWLAH